MTGAALGRTAGHDVAELSSSAELKSVRAGEGEMLLMTISFLFSNSHTLTHSLALKGMRARRARHTHAH